MGLPPVNFGRDTVPRVEVAADSTDRAKAEQRQRLLDGLAESIREKGLNETQVSDVVRLAKASRRTFYNHFPDKDSAYVELLDVLTTGIIEQLETATDRTAPVETQVDQAIDAYLEIVVNEPELAHAYWSPSWGEAVIKAQRDGYERVAAFIVDVLDQETGPEVDSMSTERAYMLIVGFHQSLMRAHALGLDLREVAADVKPVMKLGFSDQY